MASAKDLLGGDQDLLAEFGSEQNRNNKNTWRSWDPGPKQKKATDDGPVFSPKAEPAERGGAMGESMAELEGLCDTLGVEVKEKVLQQWRPYSGRLPIGTGKAEEMRQQVKYDPEVGVVVFDQDMSYRMLMTLKGRIASLGRCDLGQDLADSEDSRASSNLESGRLIFAQRARTKEAKLQVKLLGTVPAFSVGTALFRL
ncbi:unnamed protein product [Cladocopium goreaui]|uniref:GTPase HflX N-terminal domain-containing protein n=1 Tax=Cladocopium goreaui TaxID=2562237 RepID=A0A9P1FS75_9DINO|nr:unnamed protein product [Cladocopium goreaui]